MARPRERVLLTYPLSSRTLWFGERCLAAMQEVADVVLNPADRVLPPGELAALGHDCPVLVLDRLTPVGRELLELMPQLVAVVRGGVDHRHLDVAAASAAGVLATQVRPAYQASVSEMALALMLDAARGVSSYAAAYHAGSIPTPRPGRQLAGATVGIVGYGQIARHLAGLLTALGARVLACDRAVTVGPPAEPATLEALAAQSDYLLPLANSTPGAPPVIDEAILGLMKPSAWLVNVARGELVDEAALTQALDERRIAGAAMDVGSAVDQMPDPTLARRADVIATPHVGGITRESFESHAMQTVAQVAAILEGRVPDGALNAPSAHRLRERAARSR